MNSNTLIGIAISLAIFAFFGGLIYVSTLGVVDAPTPDTAPEKLAKQTLPADLTPLYDVTEPREDAKAIYYDAIAFYLQQRNRFGSSNPPRALVLELGSALVEASKAGRVSKPFLDERVEVSLVSDPDFGDALEAVPRVVLDEVDRVMEEGDLQTARTLASGVFAFGHRAFVHAERFYVRWIGLGTMQQALSSLYQIANERPLIERERRHEVLEPWAQAVDGLQKDVWTHKAQIVTGLEPQVGDLINIAKNDEDVSFRVRATLQLGVVKFNAGSVGNERGIKEAIEQLKEDENPLVAKAAEVAAQMTREDLRNVR
jgi:hypothetical protein